MTWPKHSSSCRCRAGSASWSGALGRLPGPRTTASATRSPGLTWGRAMQTENRFADDELAKWVQDALDRPPYLRDCDGMLLALMPFDLLVHLLELAKARREPPSPST